MDRIRSQAGLSTVVLLGLFSVSCRTVPLAERPSGSTRLQSNKAMVRAVRGQADFLKPNGTWEELRLGRVLEPGESVRTGEGSEVDFFLRQNGPVVRLCPNSLLRFEELSYRETGGETIITTRLDLQRGAILTNVKKLAAGSRYEIKTAKGVVHVRARRLNYVRAEEFR